jgi:hypothetical protein
VGLFASGAFFDEVAKGMRGFAEGGIRVDLDSGMEWEHASIDI